MGIGMIMLIRRENNQEKENVDVLRFGYSS